MLELAMAAGLNDQDPSIGFQGGDDVSDLHGPALCHVPVPYQARPYQIA
jgi:hypothetical protein